MHTNKPFARSQVQLWSSWEVCKWNLNIFSTLSKNRLYESPFSLGLFFLITLVVLFFLFYIQQRACINSDDSDVHIKYQEELSANNFMNK